MLDRHLKWRMSHEVVLDLFEPRRGQSFMNAEEVEQRVRELLPPGLHAFPFKIDMAQQDPRPLNPIGMQDRQIYVYDAASRTVSAEPLKELLKYLPGKVAQCRIFAMSHEHDQRLAARARARPSAKTGPPTPPTSKPGSSRRTGVMEKFRGVDYYGIDELLTEEQRMMRDAVRDWVEAKFLPVVSRAPPGRHVPDGARAATSARWAVFGATLKGYGCAGLDNVAYGLIMQELERGDSGLRSFASVQSGLVMYPIHSYGSDAQKDRWLPPAAVRRARLGCFGLTEPDHGSDPGGMKTRAVKKGNEYVLNGTKLWITNGSVADVAVVWAKGDDGEIGGYLVEKGTPGYGTLDIHGKFSMRASITSELAFADCRIPLENKLPGVKGLKGPLVLSVPGALRHRVGRDRRRHGAATTGRSSTRSSASSSASRSARSSSCSRSSCG